jgi:hypothetical protein
MNSRRQVLAGIGTMLSAAVAGCSGLTPFVGQRVESTERVSVNDASSVAVDVDAGDVTVRSEDRKDVLVDVVKQSSSVGADLSKLEFRVERPEDRVRLRGAWTGDSGLSSGPSMNLNVRVPADLAVSTAKTGTGDVDVQDVRVLADLAVSTAKAETGDVDVQDVTGDVLAQSSAGDVTVQSVAGVVRAETDTGDVTVEDIDALAGASADTGDVDVEVPAFDGDTEVKTDTGDVTAAVSADLDAEVRAETDVGDVDVNDLELSDETVGEVVAAGTLGDGGSTLVFEVDTGDVTLTALE